MSRTMSATLWSTGVFAGAFAALLSTPDPPAGTVFALSVAGGVLLLLFMHFLLPRPGVLEAGLAFWLLLAWAGGAGGTLGTALLVGGLAATTSGYFMLKLESRARRGAEASEQARERVRAALAFGTKRILFVALVAGVFALIVSQVPALTAALAGPRWAASIDVGSVAILAAVAFVFLTVTTAWTLLRMGRAETAKERAQRAAEQATPERAMDGAQAKGSPES